MKIGPAVGWLKALWLNQRRFEIRTLLYRLASLVSSSLSQVAAQKDQEASDGPLAEVYSSSTSLKLA